MKTKIFILILLSLLSSWRLFRPGYFSMQDDNQIFRLQQLDLCLKDNQIPCRYIAGGGMGYGYPLYNFYSPLAYYIAEFFHLLGFSFINSIKISFIIPAFLRTFGMYLFAASFFGTYGAILSTTLFSFAPYLALDTFVRGALSETWALSLLPFVFWSIYKHYHKLSIIFLSLLLLSHNLTLIYALPLIILFSLYTKNFKSIIRCLFWSFLICAFYLLPAYFEKNFTTISTMTQGYFYYINHFVTLKELFISNFWGYSASMWGPIDGLSFNIGLFQWFIPTIVFVFYLIKKNINHRFMIIFLYLIAIFSLFLTHSKSTFIWQLLPFMAYFQFPWRFLGLSLFCFSFISGALILILKKNLKLPIIIGLIIISIILNYPFFKEDIWYPNLNDSEKLQGNELFRQSAAGLMDYWPKYSSEFPKDYAPELPQILNGNSKVISYTKNSSKIISEILVTSQESTVNFPVIYFPDWKIYDNGQRIDYQIDKILGQIQLNLQEGEHLLTFKFVNTHLRSFANILSLISFCGFIILIIREKRS